MEGKNKYYPDKKQLTIAELRSLNEALKRENRKAKTELGEVQYALKWTRDKLQEKEDENRRLKLIILRLTEKGEADANAVDTRQSGNQQSGA